ncbi:MAG: inositol monophosphatase [Bacteroidota bacterium]|nr:inositol monophosphatase [Bacteroidota bacterium]
MEQDDLESICNSSKSIVLEVAQFIKNEFGQVAQSDIIEKEKHSLVSYVDIEAEKFLVRKLSDLISESSFITEEGTADGTNQSSYIWIIDPLDGTTNFLQGIPFFSVSLALQYKGELVMGIVHDIMRNEMFYAWKNGGAYLNGHRIHVSKTGVLDEAVIATGFPYARKALKGLAELFLKMIENARGVRRLGSAALDMAYTACGRFDAYYETGINSWDIAAGTLIVREAGGIVSDFYKQDHQIHVHNIVAGNPVLHAELMKVISSVSLEL